MRGGLPDGQSTIAPQPTSRSTASLTFTLGVTSGAIEQEIRYLELPFWPGNLSMGLRQEFRFEAAPTPAAVRAFLRGFSDLAMVEERHPEFFVFSELPGAPEFTFDFELLPCGLRSERAGQYFPILGAFIERLTGEFGPINIEDV